MTEEINRIKEIYHERSTSIKIDYSSFLPANTYFLNSREKSLLKLLRKFTNKDFEELKVLDIGFGGGFDLLSLIKYGFSVENLYGVEILEERFQRMNKILPEANLELISGFSLPFENESFDLIILSTVFSSILNFDSRKELSSEIYRILKPGAVIFSYDLRISNPWNKNVIKIDKNEINILFPKMQHFFYPVTLNPVLARRIAPFSVILCEIFEKLRFLCSHYHAVIIK